MLSYIKWLAMMLGGFRFGPGGAIVGFFIGYIAEEWLKGHISIRKEDAFRSKQHTPNYTQYQSNVLMLIAATLRADGYISQAKITYTKQFVYRNFGAEIGDWMMRQLKELTQSPVNASHYAEELRFATTREAKIKIMQMLHGLTILNGHLHLKERLLLQDISVKIGMMYSDFERIINRQQKREVINQLPTVEKAYQTLKVEAKASDEAVKKAYRLLVKQYHPDKLANPSKADNAYFDKIQKAYDQIKFVRKMK